MSELIQIINDYRLLDPLRDEAFSGYQAVMTEDFPTSHRLRIRGLETFKFLQKIPVLGDLLFAIRLLHACDDQSALLLNQVDREAQYAAIINRLFLIRKRKIVLYDVFINTPKKWKQKLVKWQVEGSDINILFSRPQVEMYAAFYGLPKERFMYIPYQASHSKRPPVDLPTEDYVFAGGNSARDYVTLCEAVRDTPIQVRITTTKPELFEGIEIPDNIKLTPVVEPEFTNMMARSRFVVMTLTKGRIRGYGEQTILNSWWHGKAVVVADDVSATDYIVDGENGYCVDPEDVAGLRKHLLDLWENPDKAETLGQAGHQAVFTHYHHENFLHRMQTITLALARSPGLL